VNGTFLGDAYGADDAEGDIVGSGGRANGENSGDADNIGDGVGGSSGGSGEIAPGGGTRPSGRGATAHASPVSATGLNRGGASGRARRAAAADAAVEAVLPGGGDVMGSLAVSLSDGARRLGEKQKTKRLVALEAERTKRLAMLTTAIEKHPDNETIRDMLKNAMGGGLVLIYLFDV